MVYMDDIIIFSETLEQHLKIQLDKCEFLCQEVQFLGHIITPLGIKPNPSKMDTIRNFPIPKTKQK